MLCEFKIIFEPAEFEASNYKIECFLHILMDRLIALARNQVHYEWNHLHHRFDFAFDHAVYQVEVLNTRY